MQQAQALQLARALRCQSRGQWSQSLGPQGAGLMLPALGWLAAQPATGSRWPGLMLREGGWSAPLEHGQVATVWPGATGRLRWLLVRRCLALIRLEVAQRPPEHRHRPGLAREGGALLPGWAGDSR